MYFIIFVPFTYGLLCGVVPRSLLTKIFYAGFTFSVFVTCSTGLILFNNY